MPQSARQQENTYFPPIDGLRAVAVLAVMIFHLAPAALPGGFSGVDIFFVISGYVVTASLAERRSQSLHQFILAFYARRIVRIVPALLVCVLVLSIAAAVFVPPGSWLGFTNRNTAIYAIFGLSNYALIWSSDGYFSPRVEFNPFAHTWSLAVEEQFYLIAPAIVYFWLAWSSKTDARKNIPLAALALLALASLGIGAYNTIVDPEAAFYLTPSRFWELAAGALLFQAQYERQFRVDNLIQRGALLGSALIACALLFSDKRHFPVPWAGASVAGTVLLIASFTARRETSSIVERILSAGPIVYVGKISYSLYLWHWPIFVLLRWTIGLNESWIMAVALILTFLMGVASYHLVEQPVRKMRLLNLCTHWQTVAAGLAVMILCFIVTKKVYENADRLSLSVVANSEIWSPYFLPSMPKGSCSPQTNRQTIGEVAVIGFLPTDCQNGIANRRKLFVVGDSHAGAYQRMLFDLVRDSGVEIWTYPIRCGIANLLEPLDQKCVKLVTAALEDIGIKGQPNDLVFLAALRIERLGNQWGAISTFEEPAERGAAGSKQRDAALDDAREYIKQIQRLNLTVLMDAPMPVFPSNAFRCSDWFNKTNPSCSATTRVSRQLLEDRRNATMRALSKLQDEFPRLFVWDTFYQLCPQDQCSSWDDKGPLFFDGDHLTGYGNEILYPLFRQQLKNIWGSLSASATAG